MGGQLEMVLVDVVKMVDVVHWVVEEPLTVEVLVVVVVKEVVVQACTTAAPSPRATTAAFFMVNERFDVCSLRRWKLGVSS